MEALDLKGLNKSREQRKSEYDEWIVRNREQGRVGDEAWGRWVAGKYRETGKVPADPLKSNSVSNTAVSQSNKQPDSVRQDAPAGESLTPESNKPTPEEFADRVTSKAFDKKAYQREYMRKKRGKS